MRNSTDFSQAMLAGYTFKGQSFDLGGPLFNGECPPGTAVRVPLRMMNRHGLIAGATGTGKTKTLQVIAEQLCMAGVPTLLMDIKGDLSGIAAPALPNPKIDARQQKMGVAWEPLRLPVELLSLSPAPGGGPPSASSGLCCSAASWS